MEANAEAAEARRLLSRAQARARTREKELQLQSRARAGDGSRESEAEGEGAGEEPEGSAEGERGAGEEDEEASALELLAREIGGSTGTGSLGGRKGIVMGMGVELLSPSSDSRGREGSTAAWTARASAMRADRERRGGVPATPPLWAKLKKLDGESVSGGYAAPRSARRPGSASVRGVEHEHGSIGAAGGRYAAATTRRQQHGRAAIPLGSPSARRTLSSPSAHGSGMAGVQAGSWVAGLRPDGPAKQSSGATRRQSGRSRFGVRALSARKPTGTRAAGSLLDDDPFVQAVADY
jgi:hypothetical protein